MRRLTQMSVVFGGLGGYIISTLLRTTGIVRMVETAGLMKRRIFYSSHISQHP